MSSQDSQAQPAPAQAAHNAGVAEMTITTGAPPATFALGERIGRAVASGLVIALCGDLGAGKTTLTQGIARGLGVNDAVTSPTFTFVNEYTFALAQNGEMPGTTPSKSRPARLYHIDLYRLPATPTAAGMEAATFGLDEILDAAEMSAPETATPETATPETAIVIIEWAERIAPALPADYLEIELAHHTGDGDPDARQISLRAHGPVSRALLHALKRTA